MRVQLEACDGKMDAHRLALISIKVRILSLSLPRGYLVFRPWQNNPNDQRGGTVLSSR